MRAAPIVACLLASAGGCGGAEPSEIEHASARVCARLAECTKTPMDDTGRALCETLYAASLQILPDPPGFERCIDALSCAELTGDDAAVVGCLALDEASIWCRDGGLRACTTTGVCRTIDCRQACAVLAATFDRCGHSQDKGHDVCWCRR